MDETARSEVVARSAIAPLLASASLRSEQVSQLVLGETARVLERDGEWRRVRCHHDGYEGWVHIGYVLELDETASARWRAEAAGWSLGAGLRRGELTRRLPLRARVAVEDGTARLPDGARWHIDAGEVRSSAEVCRAARATAPERWALEHFAGSPYLWGGVTPWGADCSGLVQTTFAARGTVLPRDATLQVAHGEPVPPERLRAGDLLFFRGDSERITHVALAGEADTLVHSAVACGGAVAESWLPGTRAASLRDRLVAVRRMEER
jgi:hypothetical protein